MPLFFFLFLSTLHQCTRHVPNSLESKGRMKEDSQRAPVNPYLDL